MGKIRTWGDGQYCPVCFSNLPMKSYVDEGNEVSVCKKCGTHCIVATDVKCTYCPKTGFFHLCDLCGKPATNFLMPTGGMGSDYRNHPRCDEHKGKMGHGDDIIRPDRIRNVGKPSSLDNKTHSKSSDDNLVNKLTELALKHYADNEKKTAMPKLARNIILCPHCKKELLYAAGQGGTAATCPFCRQLFTYPLQPPGASPSDNIDKKATPSAGVIYAPDGKPATQFKKFTTRALRRKTDMWIEITKLPTLIDELRAEHQKAYSQSEIEKIASQLSKAFTFTCRNCGKLESDTVFAGILANSIQALNPQMTTIIHGSKTFNLSKGRCPGCGNERLHVSYDPHCIHGVAPLPGLSDDTVSQFHGRDDGFEKQNFVAPGKSPAHLRLQAIYDSIRKRPMGCGVFVVGILCWIGAFAICFGLLAGIINLAEMMKIADSPAFIIIGRGLGIISLVLPFVALILCTRRYSKNNVTKRSRETESLIDKFIADFPAEFSEFFSEDKRQILNLKKLAKAIAALQDIENLSRRHPGDDGKSNKDAVYLESERSAENLAGQQLLLQIRLTHAKIARLNREVKATLGYGSTILICVLFVLYLFAGIILATCATVAILGARDNPIAGLITIVLTLVIAIIATRFHIRRQKKKQQSALLKAEAELQVSVQEIETKFPAWVAAVGGTKKLLNPRTVPEKFGATSPKHDRSVQRGTADDATTPPVLPPPLPNDVPSESNSFIRLAICENPEATIESLLNEMNSGSDPIVRCAAQSKLVRMLIQAFSDKEGVRYRINKQTGEAMVSVQSLALSTAAKIADARLVEPLIKLLRAAAPDNPFGHGCDAMFMDLYLVNDTIKALGKQRDRRAAPIIAEIAWRDDDYNIKKNLGVEAAKAIAQIGDPESIDIAVKADISIKMQKSIELLRKSSIFVPFLPLTKGIVTSINGAKSMMH